MPPTEDPFASISGEAILSPLEQLDQRARMERELAEQRKSLPDTGSTVGEPVEHELGRLDPTATRRPTPARC